MGKVMKLKTDGRGLVVEVLLPLKPIGLPFTDDVVLVSRAIL